MKRVFLVMVAVIAMVCSCQKERTNNETNENANANDEIILQKENITLQQEDTYGIKMKKGHTCKSENNFVAIVSADGKVTARHVGVMEKR